MNCMLLLANVVDLCFQKTAVIFFCFLHLWNTETVLEPAF